MFNAKPTGFIPPEDDGLLIVTFELPEAASANRTTAVMTQMMHTLEDVKAIQHYSALGGLNAITFANKSNSGTLFVQLKHWNERRDKSQQPEAVVGELWQKFSPIREANIVVIPPPSVPGLGNAGGSKGYIFALSVFVVFLFLAALYESWSVPFAVLLAVPLGAFGAILTLTLLPHLTNNAYAQIGLITLIGLSAKNAILIVEYAKSRVDKGIEPEQAALEAARLRLRPILMTSLAFLLGVLPLVLASGAGAIARQTIGWTVLGGMLAATVLSLLVVPVLFILVTRLAYGKQKLAALRSSHAAGAVPAGRH